MPEMLSSAGRRRASTALASQKYRGSDVILGLGESKIVATTVVTVTAPL